jgi:hypothetical protein
MSEQVVQVADASPSTKNMRTIQQTAGGNIVQSEVVILATGAANGGDTYDARQIRTLTSADVVTAILSGSVGQGTPAAVSGAWPMKITDGTNTAAVFNGNPVSSQYGLVVRLGNSQNSNIGNVGFTAGATINAIQSTPGPSPWLVTGNRSEGAAPTGGAHQSILTAKDITGNLEFMPVVTGAISGQTWDVPVVIDPVGQTLYGAITVSQNLLGASDKPDVTANQSGTLRVTNANIPPLSTDQYGNVNTVDNHFAQAPKTNWGPGWGKFTGW